MNLADKLKAQAEGNGEKAPGESPELDPNITTTETDESDLIRQAALEEAQKRMAAKMESEAPVESGVFTSHPIANFCIGPHRFEKGRLDYSDNPEAAAKLRNLINQLPPVERARVRELNLNSADRLARAHSELTTPNVDRTGDSGSARAAMQSLQAKFPKVGTQPIDLPNRTNGG